MIWFKTYFISDEAALSPLIFILKESRVDFSLLQISIKIKVFIGFIKGRYG